MAEIAFALTAVTVDESKVRQRASAARGRLIRLDDETHRSWSAAIYAEIKAGNVLASLRSAQYIWLLLACPLTALKSHEIVSGAKDAQGEPSDILAQLFFQHDVSDIVPYGHVPYLGTVHVAVDDSWRDGARRVRMLEVGLKLIHPGRWLLRMRSVSYTSGVRRAEKTARCFTVRYDRAQDLYHLVPTPKHEVAGYPAYTTVSATDYKVPWKAKATTGANQIDKYGLLNLLLAHLRDTLGLAMLEVKVEPLQQYRRVGSVTQAKKELMHEHVIGQVAQTLADCRFHVWSYLGRAQFMASLMAQMFPFAQWCPVDTVGKQPGDVEHMLAIVNTPHKGKADPDDVKVALRAVGFPVLQCLADTTVNAMSRSIARRTEKAWADAAAGKVEARRPPQEHEEIARGLLIQLLLKIELRRGHFLLSRPWMGCGVPVQQYAFVFHEFGDARWVVIKPNDDQHFDIQVENSVRDLRLGSRIPVMIDPPDKGKDERGKDFEQLRMSARRSVIIRNTEINAYCAQRRGHAGIWLIRELFAYLSMGSDASTSDLSTKVAPRLRVVEVYQYGIAGDNDWRWSVTLDMASLAYDPTVRLFRTAAFPVFVKLAAEIMDTLRPPAAAA